MKSNIVIIILIVVLIAVVVFLDLPFYNKVSLLRKEIKSQNDLIKERQEIMAKVDQLKETYKKREAEISRVYYVLPIGKDIPNLIVQFEALAAENGLILEKIDFVEKASKKTTQAEQGGEGTTPVSQTDYKSLGISASLTGSYGAFKSFLEALEYNIRLADLKTVDFSSQQTLVGGASALNFSITLDVYYQ